MLICSISDTHGKHQQLDLMKFPADVIVHAGDWTKGSDLGLSETLDFFNWFGKQPFKYKICIAGNHERQIEASTGIEELAASFGVTYLEDNYIIIEDVKFYGSPYSNEFCNWAFMEEEFELQDIWGKIHEDTNVLITHGPAYKCNDKVKNSYGSTPNVGSTTLRSKKLAIQDSLKLHISGHIHEAYGIDKSNPNFTSICPAVLNERYQLVNAPIIMEI